MTTEPGSVSQVACRV